MPAYSEMRELDVWYSHIVADDLLEMVRAAGRVNRRPPKRP